MATVLAILNIIGPLLAQLSTIGANAIQAAQTNDQATLDALHAQAIAAANALAPAGQAVP
jgi:type II secretory pathway component PulL